MIRKDFFNDKYKHARKDGKNDQLQYTFKIKLRKKSSKHTKRTLFIHQGHAQHRKCNSHEFL